jgi:UrcA family protein
MEITMLFRSLAPAALLALSMTAAHADDYNSAKVTIGDLNPLNPSDAKILADRLQDAAKTVCVKANPEIDSASAMQDCIDTAISTAMMKIESRLDQNVRAELIDVHTSAETP